MSKYSENLPPDIHGAIGWMLDHIKSNSTLLDFGCSTGYFGSYIKNKKNCSVFGVEIGVDKFEAQKVLDGVYSFDLDAVWPKEIYEKKYDYLFFGDILEHLKDPSRTLKESCKLLKKNGKIFVSIPNIGHISVRMELLKGNFVYEPMGILDNTHLQYFTLETFTKKAEEAGLGVRLIDYTVNDIPKEILEKQLGEIGLKASEKFWKITKSVEARAYQLKFILEPLDSIPNIKNKALPKKPLQYRDDILSDYKKQLKEIDDHSREQAKIIQHFKVIAERLEVENIHLKTNKHASLASAVKRRIRRSED